MLLLLLLLQTLVFTRTAAEWRGPPPVPHLGLELQGHGRVRHRGRAVLSPAALLRHRKIA